MYLTKEQLENYQNNGFVILPDCFSQAEVRIMKAELPGLVAEKHPGTVLEKGGKTVRSLHGSHTKNDIFRRLSQHPRLVEPATRILGSQVYIYQFKINVKSAFSGDVWKWHQDYIFWRKEDGMPTPRVVNVMVLLDDMNEFNGSLFVIPGSHKEGMIDVAERNLADSNAQSKNNSDRPAWMESFTAKLKYSLNRESVADLTSKYGIHAIKASAGSVLVFDSNIAHASPNNISPFDRTAVIITYNSIENIPLPVKNPRPEFLVSRDYRPVEVLSNDALLVEEKIEVAAR